MTNTNTHAPIDFLLIEFPLAADASSMAAALSNLVDQGTIVLFDIALVYKAGEADFGRRDLTADTTLAAFVGAQSGLFDDEDISQAIGAMEAGTQALMVAYENSWAIPFVAAALDADGQVIAGGRIPASVVNEALDATESQS
jgi:hypothetical protein